VRIAIDGRELIGKPTGVGRYLRELLTAWGELPGAAPHDVILCTPEPVTLSRPGHLRVSSQVAPGSGTLWEQRVLPRLVARAGADVLFCPAYTSPLWTPAPVVLMIHDVSFAAHPEWFSWREGWRRRTITRVAAHRASRVLTQSDFSKREICRHLRLDQSRVEVIYLGVSPLYTVSTRRPMVLYVGSLFNRRHVPELIDGFARMAGRRPDAHLEIVGDNRTRPHVDIDALVARTPAADRITVRSYVSDEELGALYGSASAFAFLSDYEGFGFTPLEAMAAGIPIVVLDTPVSREIYGPAAIYLERPEPSLIAEALDRLLHDADERAGLIDAGRRQVTRYSWHECAQRTLRVLLATS
jgi:glycosyltransferase involved in cell wall biosynthesis